MYRMRSDVDAEAGCRGWTGCTDEAAAEIIAQLNEEIDIYKIQ